MPHRTVIDVNAYREPLIAILREAIADSAFSREKLVKLLKRHLKDGKHFFATDELIFAYRTLAGSFGLPPFDPAVLERLRLKPVRSNSGVAVVTVLTKPFPCPGECIFCPNDIRMPKSYLSDEPGAQRAEQNHFDPYLQTYRRLLALYRTGHSTDKIEVIILGGTWSFYPETYQIWFVKRIFDALHDFGAGIDQTQQVEALLRDGSQFGNQAAQDRGASPLIPISGITFDRTYNQVVQSVYKSEMQRSRQLADEVGAGLRVRTFIDEYATWDELEAVHQYNETAECRCVGLVIETRPDHISEEEVIRIRRLGCTKVQIGFQSLNDDVLSKNRRGHTVAATRRAVKLLRKAGFKIHAHWMPNLYGSSIEADCADFHRLFDDPDFCPDELKIYPCSLIASAELMQHYQAGTWQPYTYDELLTVLGEVFRTTPEYCRLTRVIRDIPGTDIVVGNKVTNMREVVEKSLAQSGERSQDIRAREIREQMVDEDSLMLDEVRYKVSTGSEAFLQFITADRHIAGFLRLSLPTRDPSNGLVEPPLVEDLQDAAIIREVHVYGQALGIGESAAGKPQHLGLGTRLIERAVELATQQGYSRLAVISAIGTREYYRKRGFADGKLYQMQTLT
jgi:elongator complex protein 3